MRYQMKLKLTHDEVRVLVFALNELRNTLIAVFIAQYNYQKLQSEMENIASPKWRKLQRIF